MTKASGVVAGGHPATVAAAQSVLHEGGNAFDAVVAAHLMACVAEPVLSSLGGGGFLLAYPATGKPVLYDFFGQTPRQVRPVHDVDFHPILADFGTAQQEFHIGLGAAAVPGCVRGLFDIHRDLCTLPMTRLVEPAVELARQGTELNAFQAYIFSIVAPIYLSTPAAREIFTDLGNPNCIATAGQRLRQQALGDFLENLAREGVDLFYRGEAADRLVRLCAEQGGYLTRQDLEGYRTLRREPLQIDYRDTRVLSNPLPASGGVLIAFALDLLERISFVDCPFGSSEHLRLLAAAMELANHARQAVSAGRPVQPDLQGLFDPRLLARYRAQMRGRAQSVRGTTHVSVMDAAGNVAAMTVSNGEGCGHLVPGTGVMLNNLLGEEDINPGGFHRWRPNRRLTSMMAPSMVLFADGRRLAIGSGGSNRIRSAILQVLVNLVDFGLDLETAVHAPRIHLEGSHLSVEGGYDPERIAQVLKDFPEHTLWQDRNLFFGGTHAVMGDGATFSGVGDPRRGGNATVVGPGG